MAQSQLATEAQQLFNNQDFDKAYIKYLELVDQEKENVSAWFNKGRTEIKLQKFQDARTSLEQALELGFQPVAFVHFNLAKCFAQLRKPASSFDQIDLALENGFAAFNRLESDAEFAPLLMRKKFQDAILKAKQNAYPCLANPHFNKFDFWLGDWEVYTRQGGIQTGYNSITKATGGCAVHESYTTLGSYAGQSINFFDPIAKKWKQHWIGSGGDIVNFVETEDYDCSLQFMGKSMQADGTISLKRLSFTYNSDDDTVHQLGEGSSDDGQSWNVEYDLIYRRIIK
jgi:tetratricopeptide (TPR) repeat protein